MSLQNQFPNLDELALNSSKPFCYTCYQICESGVCPTCHSDDLMRYLEGVGVEYGLEWIIEHLVETKLSALDVDASFESMLEDCYGAETTIGFIIESTIEAIKSLDPVAFEIAKQEHIDSLIEDGQIVEVSGSYYLVEKLEGL